MVDVDWDLLNKQAKKLSEQAKIAQAANEPLQTSVDVSQQPIAQYQQKPLLGQLPPAALTANQEQQAADSIGASIPQQPISSAQAPIAQTAMPQIANEMVPLQQTVTGISLPAGVVQEDQRIKQRAFAAQDAQTNALIAQNNLLAENAKANAAQLAELNKKSLEQAAADASAMKAKEAELQSAIDDYNANKKVNPNRKMQSLGAGGTIGAAIAAAFGAFGSAMTKTPNYAQQMIERAIDRDIEAQKEEIAERKNAVSIANNNIALFRQKGLDNQAAIAAERVRQLQLAAAKVDEIMAGTQNAKVIATGEQIKSGLEKAYNDELKRYGQRQVSTTSQNPAVAGASAGAQLPANQAAELGQANAAIKATEDLYRAWEENAQGPLNAIASYFPGTDATKFGDKRAMTKQIVGSYLENGVLKKEDEAKYERYLPEPGDSKDRALKKRDSLMALISQKATEQKKAQGQAGFNVKNIEIRKPVTTFKPVQ